MEYHAERSPSSAVRWMTCPGSVPLSAGKPDTTGADARWGSAGHEIAALALTSGGQASAYLGRLIEVNGFEVEVTEEMAEAVQVYVDAVRQRVKAYELSGATVTLEVEQDVPIGHITLETGATGRADVILIAEFPDNTFPDTMEVWDLKLGRGVEVSAEGNAQGQMYALGAAEKFGMVYTFDTIGIVIHQPRLSKVPSEWATTPAALKEFSAEATRASHDVRAAKLCFEGNTGGFEEKYLRPSEKACRFCKAKPCAAQGKYVAAVVLDDFEDLSRAGVEQAVAAVPDRGADNLANAMASVDLIEDWCKAVRAETERRLLAGADVPGFKLVQGRQGARKWADPAEAETLFKGMRLRVEEMYDFTLISPTAAEKLTKAPEDGKPVIGPRQWPKVEALVTRSAPKPSVAPASDKRPALVVTPAADQFEDLSQAEAIA